MSSLSKKNIIFISLLLTALGVALGKMSDNGNCGQLDACLLAAYPLLVFIPVFVFSLVAYFAKDEVFSSWRKLTNWWVVIAIFLVAISPEQQASLLGFDKKDVLFLFASIYAAISLILIAYKSYRLRGK